MRESTLNRIAWCHPLAAGQRDGVVPDRVLEFVGPYLQAN